MARRIPGEFVPSDVNLANDPKILRAGYRAELLFRRANEYSKRMNSDGLIFAVDLPIICHGIPGPPTRHAASLVQQGLWHEIEGGWEIVSFLKWNLSQEEQDAVRHSKRVGAAKTNHKKGAHSKEADPECPLCRVEGVAA